MQSIGEPLRAVCCMCRSPAVVPSRNLAQNRKCTEHYPPTHTSTQQHENQPPTGDQVSAHNSKGNGGHWGGVCTETRQRRRKWPAEGESSRRCAPGPAIRKPNSQYSRRTVRASACCEIARPRVPWGLPASVLACGQLKDPVDRPQLARSAPLSVPSTGDHVTKLFSVK